MVTYLAENDLSGFRKKENLDLVVVMLLCFCVVVLLCCCVHLDDANGFARVIISVLCRIKQDYPLNSKYHLVVNFTNIYLQLSRYGYFMYSCEILMYR